ncbi:amidase [Citricoccus sp. GCM10030269]|uniref:amidase n=1 Tax=Citricoccus sp. GCM10030269 TaxID=3273388 RepID=UPI003620CFBB
MEKESLLTVAELARALASGETTAEDTVTRLTARIAEVDGAVGAWTHVATDAALEAARESDRRRREGAAHGFLDGVPFAVKENLFVRGLPSTWGSELWRSHVPDRDDIAVERLRAVGAVVLGMTNTPELAMSFTTDNRLHGTTRNPADLSLTPGGSSGGSAAAVASGTVPFALSTDAGGSTRLPAALTSLYGLRPTTGRVPRRWGFPALASDFQVVGAVTRTVEDLELVFQHLAGPDRRDPVSLFSPSQDARSVLGRGGWFTDLPGVSLDPVIAERVEAAALALSDAGHPVDRIPPLFDRAVVERIWDVMRSIGVAEVIAARRAADPDAAAAVLTDGMAELERRGRSVSASELWSALDERHGLRASVADHWGDLDFVLAPVTPTPAWSADAGGSYEAPSFPGAYTAWVNAIGYPAMSVPVAPHPDGRPIGVQIIARPGAESTLFAVARALTESGQMESGVAAGSPQS